MKNKLYRQGDVFIEECSIPTGTTKKKDKLLVEGEASNHAHYASCDVLEDEVGNMYLNSKGEISIKHLLMDSGQWTKEHHDIVLPPGGYKVTIQRCYNPYKKAIEQVKD